MIQPGINTPKYYTNNDLLHYSVNDLIKIYIDSVAIAADSAYNFEVNYLGYPPPPPDNGVGGDDKYDIYIENIRQCSMDLHNLKLASGNRSIIYGQ